MGYFGEYLSVVGRLELSPGHPFQVGLPSLHRRKESRCPGNGSGGKALAQSSHGEHLGSSRGWTLASAFILGLWFPQSGDRLMGRQVGRKDTSLSARPFLNAQD